MRKKREGEKRGGERREERREGRRKEDFLHFKGYISPGTEKYPLA